ncbi:hypothetical protein KR044_010400, partial [Drosophila immigrans]
LVWGQDFDYISHPLPPYEPNHFQCSAKLNNLIDINDQNVEPKEFPEIHYFNFEITPKLVHLTNNGRTVVVKMNYKNGKDPRIKGGPLEPNSSYHVEQLHFYWGPNDTVDNNYALPMELHLVAWNLEYKDFESALGQDNGIAVLAFIYRIARMDHLYYDEFMQTISTINRKGLSADLKKPLPLQKFLPGNNINYYSYTSTLTTPPCGEKVVWIDYREPIYISERQLNLFREITFDDDDLKNDYSPPQLVHDRIIYENIFPVQEHLTGTQGYPLTRAPDRNSCNSCRGQALFLVSFLINLRAL